MTIIGVTGGIGAGKTSVSEILRELGAVVIDADRISREVVEPHKPAWIEIRRAFGSGVFNEDETLDREKLARIVFSCTEKKLELERIIHKEVVAKIEETLGALKDSGYNGVAVLDVPIPIKRGFLDIADSVWAVYSNDETRIKRVMERSGIDREDAQRRIKSQFTQEEYKKLAHETIENNGSFDELKEKVTALYNKITRPNFYL